MALDAFEALRPYGWTPQHAARFLPFAERGLAPARVTRADRDRWLVFAAGSDAALPAVVSGRFRHDAAGPAEFPAVGDWVAVAPGDPCVIHAVLPRGSAFRRLAPGRVTVEQVIAANVDVVFLVSGLDGDFNPRRIERYVAAVWESGALPVVVLNKADMLDGDAADALADRVAEVEAVAIGVPVVALSAREGRGLDALAPHLLPGRTIALVGSSGVGKSTLVNALLGEERQDTGAVRADDSRGRHTTTYRELVPLPGDVLLLDTPGMREFALWAGGGEAGGDGAPDGGLGAAFPEIEELAASCRFGDCAHELEPGCAVQAALVDGALPAERHASWRKLQRELRAFAIRHDVHLQHKERARWKAVSSSVRAHMKRKYGK